MRYRSSSNTHAKPVFVPGRAESHIPHVEKANLLRLIRLDDEEKAQFEADRLIIIRRNRPRVRQGRVLHREIAALLSKGHSDGCMKFDVHTNPKGVLKDQRKITFRT